MTLVNKALPVNVLVPAIVCVPVVITPDEPDPAAGKLNV